MKLNSIIETLPYSKPFLFVDELISIDENRVEGTYTFDPTHDFYKGHFKNMPVTPGVILTEVMAQIGLVCLGIYLLGGEANSVSSIALTAINIEFLKPVYPGEKVTVVSHKLYFRFGKLKCDVAMTNENAEEVCIGQIAGLIIPAKS